jgi:hypothetical protein
VAYYADLSPCDYFGRWEEVLIAVGWLEQGHSFATGKVSKEFFAQLVDLLRDPWQPAVAAGFHRCDFCQNTGERNTIAAGTANLFIPARAGIYVAPSLITHYVDAHECYPPADFQQAVLKCPEMKSFAYLRDMRARGLNQDAS